MSDFEKIFQDNFQEEMFKDGSASYQTSGASTIEEDTSIDNGESNVTESTYSSEPVITGVIDELNTSNGIGYKKMYRGEESSYRINTGDANLDRQLLAMSDVTDRVTELLRAASDARVDPGVVISLLPGIGGHAIQLTSPDARIPEDHRITSNQEKTEPKQIEVDNAENTEVASNEMPSDLSADSLNDTTLFLSGMNINHVGKEPMEKFDETHPEETTTQPATAPVQAHTPTSPTAPNITRPSTPESKGTIVRKFNKVIAAALVSTILGSPIVYKVQTGVPSREVFSSIVKDLSFELTDATILRFLSSGLTGDQTSFEGESRYE